MRDHLSAPKEGKHQVTFLGTGQFQKGSRMNASTLRESFGVGSPLNQLGCSLSLLSEPEESQR